MKNYLPEVKFPVKTTPSHIRCCDVFKSLVGNHINHRTHDGFSVFGDLGKERLQPTLRAFTMGVQEGDDRTLLIKEAKDRRPKSQDIQVSMGSKI